MKRNYVAKYAARIQKSQIFKDKKRALKRGEQKHKRVNTQIEREYIAA